MLGKLTVDHDLMKSLHMLLYKTPGTKINRKKNVRAFNGFPAGTDLNGITAKVIANKKWTVAALKDASQLCGLEKGGDRETIIGRLVGFLNKPTALKAPVVAKKKASGASTPGKKAKKVKKDGPKRPLSSYMVRTAPVILFSLVLCVGVGHAPARLPPSTRPTHPLHPSTPAPQLFAKDARPDILKKNPDLPVTAVATKIGELWRGLSEGEKAKYKAKADKAKADAAKVRVCVYMSVCALVPACPCLSFSPPHTLPFIPTVGLTPLFCIGVCWEGRGAWVPRLLWTWRPRHWESCLFCARFYVLFLAAAASE